MPEVSVIIPTYNRAKWVKEAVESVIAQDFPDYEVLVVDDGSTDKTRETLSAFGKGIQIIEMEHSGLPAQARNKGIQAARGTYLAFLDSDDRWLPGKLSRQMKLIQHHPEAGLCCTNAAIQREGEAEWKETFFPSQPDFVGDALSALIRNNFIITSSVLIRKDLVQSCGGFDESERLRALEDYDLWLKVAGKTRIGYLCEALVIYNDRPTNSLRSQRKPSQNWAGTLLILDRLEKSLRANKVEPQPALLRTLQLRKAASYRALIRSLWEEKSLLKFLKACGEAALSQPGFNLELARRKLLGQKIQYSEIQNHEYFAQR
jgi:glycosyltransferase involved in cell wall biosynthesis